MSYDLHSLKSDALRDLTAVVSTPDALLVMLRARDEVSALTNALMDGVIAPTSLRAFVADLTVDLRRGEIFPWDAALSAIAAALESLPSPFAEEYLRDLSELRIKEIPMAGRVASLARRHRDQRFAATTAKNFRISAAPFDARSDNFLSLIDHVPRVRASEEVYTADLQAA